jgi:hypothetical protein
MGGPISTGSRPVIVRVLRFFSDAILSDEGSMSTQLSIVYRDIDGLVPYARNARTHSDEQIAQLAASLREFGWTNPVLLDGDFGIIAGHGRVPAARKLGMREIPTIDLAHLNEAQRRAYARLSKSCRTRKANGRAAASASCSRRGSASSSSVCSAGCDAKTVCVVSASFTRRYPGRTASRS